jgi:hypothetical protein
LSSHLQKAVRIFVPRDNLGGTASAEIGVGKQVSAPGLKPRAHGRKRRRAGTGAHNEKVLLVHDAIEDIPFLVIGEGGGARK